MAEIKLHLEEDLKLSDVDTDSEEDKRMQVKSVVVVLRPTESDDYCSEAEVQEAEMALIKKKKMKANAAGKFECEVEVCKARGKLFGSVASLHRHWAVVHQPYILLYACPEAEGLNCRWQKRVNEVAVHLKSSHSGKYPTQEAALAVCKPRSRLAQGVRKNTDYVNPQQIKCPFKMRGPHKEGGAPALPVSRKRQSSSAGPAKTKKSKEEYFQCGHHQPVHFGRSEYHHHYRSGRFGQAILGRLWWTQLHQRYTSSQEEMETELQVATDRLTSARQDRDRLAAALNQSLRSSLTRAKARELSNSVEKEKLRRDLLAKAKTAEARITNLEAAGVLKDQRIAELEKLLQQSRDERRDLESKCRRSLTSPPPPTFPPIRRLEAAEEATTEPQPSPPSAVNLQPEGLTADDGTPDFNKLLSFVSGVASMLQAHVKKN